MRRHTRRAPKLTAEERRLLDHPPTEGTWYCVHSTPAVNAEGEEYLRESLVTNSARRTTCAFCTEPRPADAPLAWPVYQAALAKVAPPQEPLEGAS